MQRLDTFIEDATHLPPAPVVLPRLMVLLNKEDVDADEVTRLVALDPALVASVLRLCNSASFGGSRQVDNLPEATTRLGFKQLYKLVTIICGAKTLGNEQTGYGLNNGELWQHSVTSAVASQLVARDLGMYENVAFTATLMHDLGKIVLTGFFDKIYMQLLEELQEETLPFVEVEKKLLGVNHAEMGGRLLDRWEFPKNLVNAVWYHHNPAEAKENKELASMVHVGNLIAHCLGHAYGHNSMASEASEDSFKELGLRASSINDYIAQVSDEFETIQEFCNVTT